MSDIADDVRRGLRAPAKWLPPHLFYDAAGSRLYEEITELDEYYPTRTERAILARHAADVVALAAEGLSGSLHVVELGAGSATKTRLVLEAVIARQGRCTYVPIDVSATALEDARARLAAELPAVDVRPVVGRHQDAHEHLARPSHAALGPRRLVLFIGSSVGNFEDDEAAALLAGVRRGLAPGGCLLLGTDLRKDPARLIPAYDDARGVTAAFNKNVLARINRELGGDFDLARFRHVALWNDAASRVEMHLESTRAQRVHVRALDLHVDFEEGERIHTESSIKYDLPRVDRLLEAAGFRRAETFFDEERLFAVHVARATA